ncbi:MAG: alpha-glucosidase C-terminal domain-containing protein, partial [Dehalococcoidia bacterium]
RHGGFTAGEPWLPYGDLTGNVEDQSAQPRSLLSLYRRMAWFRRRSDALRFGDYAPVDGTPPGIYAYTRTHGDERLLTALNFTDEAIAFDLPAALRVRECVLGTHEATFDGQQIALAPNEGRLLRLG